MKKLLSILMLLVAIVTGAWASTVNDLATISSDYTFISDNVTSSGTAGLTGGTLYDSNKILSVGGNSVATNKGNSTFGGATHLNSLRIKGDQNQLAFKVAGACTITFYQQSHSSRKLQAGTSSYSNNLGSGGTSTTSWTLDLSSLTGSTVIYLSSTDPSKDDPKQADMYIAGFVVTMIAAPTITAVDAASIKATTSGVDATTNIDIQGSNLTGSTLTATLSPEVEGLSVGLASSAITAGAISTTATLTYNRTANVKQGTTTLTISDGTTSKDITVTYSAKVEDWTLQSIGESTTWTFNDANITSGSLNSNISAIYANIDGMAFGSDFDATALELVGATWPYYSDGNIAQSKTFKFKTTVPGTVKVTYNKAGDAPVYISVNGGNNGSATSATTTDAIAVNAGYVTISGYSDAEHTSEALLNVSKIEFVRTVPVTDVDLNKTATTLAVGDTETLVATVSPSNATNKNVTWESLDETVATVSSEGVVTAVKAGEAAIRATTEDGGFFATCLVIVQAGPLVTLPTETRDGYSVSGATETTVNRSDAVLNGEKVYLIGNGGTATITVPATTTVSKIRVVGTCSDGNTSSVQIKGVESEQTAATTFNHRDNGPLVTLDFVPTTQTTTYTVTSSNKGSWVKILIYGTEGSTTETITPAKEYTTFSCTKALDFSDVEGLEAYAAVSADGGKVTMTKVTDIPANTGLVLKKTGTATSYNVPVGTATSLGVENKLVAATTATAVEAYDADNNVFNYILKDGAFHPATAGTLAAGKAYLHLEASAGTQGLVMEFDDAPTAVEAVAEAKVNVNVPVKVIKNGQLFIGNYNVAGARVK